MGGAKDTRGAHSGVFTVGCRYVSQWACGGHRTVGVDSLLLLHVFQELGQACLIGRLAPSPIAPTFAFVL